jgi:WD40 repeat protein
LQRYVVRSTADDHSEQGDVRQGQLSVRRVADRQEIAHLPGFGVRVVATQFSPNGRYLAAHYEWGQRQSCVWDLSRREAILKVSQGSHYTLPSFSPDSRWVALSQPDHSIRIHELPSGATWKDLPPRLAVNSVQFHPDGRRLAVISGQVVQLRDVNGGQEVATFTHTSAVASLAWRSDGKVFAIGCHDHNVYIWDTANSAQPLRTLTGHFGPVVNLRFSHGGDLLFSNSWDSTDRLWGPMTGQQLVSRPGGVYREHHFGPDDQGLDDGWQVATGRECRTFHGNRA